MRYKYLLILFFFLCLHTFSVKAQENVYTDTLSLSYDIEKVVNYQNNSKFDYNSQLIQQDHSLWTIFMEWIGKLLSKIFGSQFAENYTQPILIAVFVIIILLVLFFIYRKRPELFFRERKKKKGAYLEEEETIHDVDFEEEIINSLRSNNYKLATRLTYLQTLKYLNDGSYISWQPYKTPTEYIYEMKKADCKDEFRQLTNHFLRIRYGNFEATQKTYETVRELQNKIVKGGQS